MSSSRYTKAEKQNNEKVPHQNTSADSTKKILCMLVKGVVGRNTTTQSDNNEKYLINALELEEEIGFGSSSTVYKGKVNGKQVAVKQLSLDRDKYHLSMNEKTILERLKESTYPNFSTIKYIGFQLTTQLNIVMEYMPNGSLDRLVYSDQGLYWPTSYQWMQQLTEGVKFLHANDILHLDLKTENILLDANMNVKIGDFGLASFVKDAKFKHARGTITHLPPEIFTMKGSFQYDKKCDMYGLGVLFWEIAAREWPYEGQVTRASQIKPFLLEGNRLKIPQICPPKVSAAITWLFKPPEERPLAEELSEELASDMHYLSETLSRHKLNGL